MSRSGEWAMQQEEQQNLSGAFDHEEYMESQFEKDFAEFVASREKDYKESQHSAESAQPVVATQ